MPHIIAIQYSEAQPRQIAEILSQLANADRPLSAKYEAENFPSWSELFSTIIQPSIFVQQESFVVYNSENLGPFPENDGVGCCRLPGIQTGKHHTKNHKK